MMVLGDRFVNRPTLRGRLLVALPPLVDENFDRTVVLMLEHTDGGALGVVLNRPGERDVPSVLEPWEPYTSPPAVIFEGGPVETELGDRAGPGRRTRRGGTPVGARLRAGSAPST